LIWLAGRVETVGRHASIACSHDRVTFRPFATLALHVLIATNHDGFPESFQGAAGLMTYLIHIVQQKKACYPSKLFLSRSQ
jgi:hypothetical protein